MGLFGFGKKKPSTSVMASGPRMDPKWVRTATGKFHRFSRLDPEAEGLSKASGVYVIWHAGVQSGWVYVGRSKDLAGELNTLADNDEINEYESRGGLFVTWARIRDEFQDGVVRFLTDTLDPKVENPSAARKAEPIPVLSPGGKPDAKGA